MALTINRVHPDTLFSPNVWSRGLPPGCERDMQTAERSTVATGHAYRGLSTHKPFGLEPLGIELEAEMLRAERFTPPDRGIGVGPP